MILFDIYCHLEIKHIFLIEKEKKSDYSLTNTMYL